MDGVDQAVLSPTVWRADSSYNIAAMAANGVGWAILPLNIAEYEGYSNALVGVPCADLSLPMLSVRALWLRGRSLSETELWIQRRMGELLRLGAP
jgi:DNA-binding transcriptional LysR family regulator